jgi:hypothetical protein
LPVSSGKIIGRAGMSIEEGYNLWSWNFQSIWWLYHSTA